MDMQALFLHYALAEQLWYGFLGLYVANHCKVQIAPNQNLSVRSARLSIFGYAEI
jgi:hypothetical protein